MYDIYRHKCGEVYDLEQRISFGKQQQGQSYIQRTGVYAVILRFQGGQVAVIKNERGLYFLPGGGLEPGEDHTTCLERELREETGYQIHIGRYIGQAEQYHMSFLCQPILGIGHFYFAKMQDKLHDPSEPGELVWLDPRQASQSLFLESQAWAVCTALRMPH